MDNKIIEQFEEILNPGDFLAPAISGRMSFVAVESGVAVIMSIHGDFHGIKVLVEQLPLGSEEDGVPVFKTPEDARSTFDEWIQMVKDDDFIKRVRMLTMAIIAQHMME